MSKKNLLSDTDYTSGKDNRYKASVHIGYVTTIECNKQKGQANVRVSIPDKVDHKGTPLITKPIPVMQVASAAKKSFAVPRIGDCVLLNKMPNGTSDYFVAGSFYTTANPPPVDDPMLDHCTYDDGSIKEFNATTGSEHWDLKGGILFDTDKNIAANTQERIILNADNNITLQAKTGAMIELIADTIRIVGNIQHTGDIITSGFHTDQKGGHAGNLVAALEERIAALEARIAELEQRHGG